MARKFSVFILAVLAVVLCVSSALGAATYTITKTITSGDWGAYSSKDKTLTISKDGTYTFSDFGPVSIDKLIIHEATKSWDVKEATIQLPGPVAGKWEIQFPTTVRDPKNQIVPLDNKNRTKLTITKGSSSTAAIIVDSALEWTLKQGNDLVIDAPLKVGSETASVLGLTLTVGDAATATFTENAEIRAFKDSDLATGYTASGVGAYAGQSAAASTYTIAAGGELIIRNASAIRGSNLTVTTATGTGTEAKNKKATLTLDLTAKSTLDLRGITGSASTNLETAGSNLKLDGSLFVSSDITLWGQIAGNTATTITKAGSGTLTLANSGKDKYFPRPSILPTVTTISIDAGSLVFASQRSVNTSTKYATWAPTGTKPKIVVGKNASFTANSSTIIQEGEAIIFDVKGTATFKNHAILKKGTSKKYDEIYPYENYSNTTNTLKINATETVLTVVKGGKIIVDGGFLAAGTISGDGVIEINGSGLDKAALILSSPATPTKYANFKGTINGTHANVGLYGTEDTYKPNIFSSATVSIDNLLIYGTAQLTIDANTNLDGVKYVWLRSDRPGAANFKDGSINSSIASAKLKVGALNFALSNKSSDIYLDGLKVDGTASPNTIGLVKVVKSGDKGLNVYLSNIELYANRGTGLDFTRYATPYSGIYALSIDSSVQPSRIYIDGKTVTGEGLVADAAAIYQVQIAVSSDVHFTGTGDFYPVAKNNSLLVESCAKLEIDKGGIINGNLKFEAGTVPLSEFAKTWRIFDAIFTSNNGWYSTEAGGYTVFATHIGSENRRNGNTGEFAVKVTGSIEFDEGNIPDEGTMVSVDKASVQEGGFVVVRTLPDPTAFDSSMTTTKGQRFMLLGTTGADSTCGLTSEREYLSASGDVVYMFLPNCVPALERIFTFSISDPQYMPNDVEGIIVEPENELAIVNLGEASFLEGGADFGMGDGHNFVLKIPFTVSLQGEQVELKKEYTTSGYAYYIQSGVYKWYFEPHVAFLKFDSKYYTIDNVPDLKTQLSSSDIVANITFDFSGTEPYIKIVGTSYSGTKPVSVSVALYLEQDEEQPSTLGMVNGVRAGFREYSLIRSGSAYGNQYSSATVTALPPVDVTENASGNVSFTVSNFYKANEKSSLPTLIDGRYVWDNGADSGTYNIPDSSGRSVTVSNVVLILYNGSTNTATQKVIASGFTITPNGTTSTITLPITALGDTGGKFDAVKMLAVRGTRTEGTGNITTQPASYTLHSAGYDSGSKAVSELTKTVKTNETATASYTIPASEVPGASNYIDYSDSMPSWLNLSLNGNTLSYTTSSLQGVTPRKYDFRILVYSGENSSSSPHKLYTFSITVTAAPVVSNDFSLTASPNTVAITLPDTAVVNLTPVKLSGSVSYKASHEWVTFSGNTATLKPTTAGSYDVTITATDSGRKTANTATARISVRVSSVFTFSAPATAAITLPGNAVLPLKTANALGTVSYRSSQSWVTFSGDNAVLKPTSAGSYDVTITAIDYGRTPPATVSASIAVTVKAPTSGDKTLSGDFGLTSGTTQQTITLPNTASITLTPLNSRGTVSYKANQSWVTFTQNTATLAPTNPGNYTVIITATDSGRTTANTATATITLTVKAGQLALSTDEKNISVGSSGSAAVTLKPTNAQGAITYTANYSWVTFNGNTATITPPKPGTYDLEITASDEQNSAKVNITVTSGATPPVSDDFTLSADKATMTIALPASGTVNLTPNNAQGTVSYSYAVSPGIGLTVSISGNTATLTATTAGTYTITFNATDSGNRKASASVTATFTGTVPTPVSGDFTLSADKASLTIALPASGTLTLTPANAQGAVRYAANYEWVTFSGNTATFAPTAAGNYTVTITATDSQGRTAAVTVAVRVNGSNGSDDVPAGTFALSAPAEVTVAYLDSADVTLTPSNALGAVTYSAEVTPSFGLEVSFTGNTMNIFTYTTGTYTVTITATDSGRTTNNTATATITVRVPTGGRAVGSSSGGCDSGFGAISLAVLGLSLLRKHRK